MNHGASESGGSLALGEILRRTRVERGLTGTEAARAAGLRRRHIRDFERGRVAPTDHELAVLAAVYLVPVERLVPPGGRITVVATGTGGEVRGAAALDALLREYVSMVLELRGASSLPATTLRHEDLTELARALGGTPDAIEAKLVELLGADESAAHDVRTAIFPTPVAG
jgi:transcriptional regulator with XRE-family HTH domain